MEKNPGFLGIAELKIPVPWGHVSAKSWGDARTGKPVIAVHGWLDNAGTFDTLIPLLPKSLYVIALDMPGHGHSSHLPPGIPYHYIDLVAAIRRVTAHLKLTRFCYMGHSMGAALGVMYASIYPEQVERLVLLDLVRPITNPADGCLEGVKSGLQNFLLWDKAQVAENESPVTHTYETALERLILVTQYSNYPLTESAGKTMLIRGCRRVSEEEYTYNRDQRMMSATILRFSHEQLFDMMKGLKCHLLMVKATEASWYQAEELYEKAIKTYQEVCPSFKLVKVPGNHFVHLNYPRRLSEPVSEFLTVETPNSV